MSARLGVTITADGTQYTKTVSDAERRTKEFQRNVNNANREVNSFANGLGGLGRSLSGAMSSLKSGDILGFTNNIRGASAATAAIIPINGSAATSFKALGASITTALGPIGLIVAGVAAIGSVIGLSINAVEKYNKSIKDFSALTGMTGPTLDEVGEKAKALGEKYGMATTEVIDSMSKIGSQAPQLLQSADALSAVAEAATVLQKADGNISLEESSRAITTVMNQMGVAASEATGIINSLAAGSQKGSADINYLNQAIAKSGAQAAEAGMSYQQLVAAVETIAPKFASAEVAGTALNTLLVRLQTQAESKFNPAIVGMEKALDNLAAANLSAEDKVKLFGQSALLAGNTLIQARQSYVDMSNAVTGTNTAYEQMETKSGSISQSIAKLKVTFENLFTTIGQSPIVQALTNVFQFLIEVVTNVIHTISSMVSLMNKWNSKFDLASKTINALVTVLRVLWQVSTSVFDAIMTIVNALVDKVINKWEEMKNSLADTALFQGIKAIFQAIYDFVFKVISGIKRLWQQFLEWLGVEKKEMAKDVIEQKVEVNTDELKKIEAKKNDVKVKGGKTKIEFEEGSLDAYKDKLTKLQKQLTSKKISLVDAQRINSEIDDLKGKIEQKEIELGLKPKEGSIAYIENKIAEIDAQIKNLHPVMDNVKISELQISRDALVKAKTEAEAMLNGITSSGKLFKSDGAEGSSRYAGDKVQYYKSILDITVEGEDRYNNAIKKIREWTDKQNQINLQITADLYGEDSIKYLTQAEGVYKAQLEISAKGTPEYEEAIKNLKELVAKKQVIETQIKYDTTDAKKDSAKMLDMEISDLKAKLDLEVVGSDDWKKLNKDLKELTRQKQKAEFVLEVSNMSSLEKVNKIFDSLSSIDGVYKAFENLTSVIEEDKNAWEVFMAVVQVAQSIMGAYAQIMETVTMITTALGLAKRSEADIEKQATAESVSNAAQEIAASTAKTSAKSGEAVAGATASGASIGFPWNLIAIALGVAAVIAALANISKFAEGGIFGGSGTIGDMNLARVNKGEMILNNRQQANLFRAINNNSLGSNNSTTTGSVKIKGTDMYLVMKNLNGKKKLVGKNIGIQ